MAKMRTMPEVMVVLTPKLRVLINGSDVTNEWGARASVTLGRLGRACGMALRQFEVPFQQTRSGVDLRKPSK